MRRKVSKKYDLYCPNHGRIHIEVEKLPFRLTIIPTCPFCSSSLMKQSKGTEKRWQQGLAMRKATT